MLTRPCDQELSPQYRCSCQPAATGAQVWKRASLSPNTVDADKKRHRVYNAPRLHSVHHEQLFRTPCRTDGFILYGSQSTVRKGA
jgi:hypothetical protein